MKFVLLIYHGTTPLPDTDAWSSLPEEEQKAIYSDYAALNKRPELTPGLPLGLPADAKTVWVDNGRTVMNEGPVIGVDCALGGYMIVDVEDLDAAVAIAAGVPAARHGGAIEVRPVATYW